jgi:glycosyltransferase involved in cell wall biosynthesis
MGRSRLAIIIPAYNEAATIANVVSAISCHGITIVIDDGSNDETANFARAAGAKVVSHLHNLGYDAALNSGFHYANKIGCDYAVTLDADGQHNPDLLESFFRELEMGADIVVGMRDKKQRFAEHIFALISCALWGISDPLCGVKAYRMDLYRTLGHFDAYKSVGTELAIYAARQHKKISQLPVVTRNRADASRFGCKFSANCKILKALYRSIMR